MMFASLRRVLLRFEVSCFASRCLASLRGVLLRLEVVASPQNALIHFERVALEGSSKCRWVASRCRWVDSSGLDKSVLQECLIGVFWRGVRERCFTSVCLRCLRGVLVVFYRCVRSVLQVFQGVLEVSSQVFWRCLEVC